ncbi:hypothetical protein VNI00_007362 [Paramarasmius palmivorus]|uniref:Uncharacterized protein n=1 Tax=Paramarasmius palmivorus TaxID=297713 RepID=A0AAW0D4C9_9AGAR
MPSKLHLKRTPEEEAARRLRKKEKKAAKRHRTDDGDSEKRKRRRHTRSLTPPPRKWDSSDEDGEFIGPEPAAASSSHSYTNDYTRKPDYDAIQAELEEQRFREKLSSAFDEDEAYDAIEARFNSFAHVPMHWGGSGGREKQRVNFDDDGFMGLDPMTMDEEDYAEWVRRGMYRKTHAQEYEEQERKKSERAAKREKEKAIQAETERLERAAAEERKRKKHEKENRRWAYAREEYHSRWQELLSSAGTSQSQLGFRNIPWPVLSAHRQKPEKKDILEDPISVSLDDLNRDAITSFLLLSTYDSKERKDKLRETFLRFHPDKFEGRFMQRVRPDDQEKVRMGLASVVRVLNDLMGEGG